MKHLINFLLLIFFCLNTHSQSNLSGYYGDTGYFFHPASPRTINITKYITQIAANVYQADFGDLGSQGYSFQFSIDQNHNLINWTPVGNTPSLTSSGFMTTDNPAGISTYPGTTTGFISSIYNNTYDAATNTFYMHYGYGTGSSNQNGFTRQVYEKYVLYPSPRINSVSTLTGTSFTKVTIKGSNFNTVKEDGVSFGNQLPDSVVLISDSVIVAWVGSGGSGSVKVTGSYGSDSMNGFIYYPVANITKPLWNNLGNLNSLTANSHDAAIAVNSQNIPYVVFSDSIFVIRVMKYNNGIWQNVGNNISDGKASHPIIAFDSANSAYVSYIDSLNNGMVSLKKYDGNNWITIGNPGFSKAIAGKYSFVMDGSTPYVTNLDTLLVYPFKYTLSVLKFDGNIWDTVGAADFGIVSSINEDLAIDHKTHTPYVIYPDADTAFNMTFPASIQKFDGTKWVYIGQYLNSSLIDEFIPPTSYNNSIVIDTSGNPIVSLTDNKSFERQYVYTFLGGNWKQMGNKYFSKSHSYGGSVVIDKNNNPYVLFQDYSYNKQGTVMQLDSSLNIWNFAGARGFADFDPSTYSRQSLTVDTTNNLLIAFVNKDSGNSISVMSIGMRTHIKGAIITASGQSIQVASLIVSGDIPNNAVSNSNGKYAINVIQSGSYTITPSKNNDINKTNGVTAIDIALTQAHILGKNLLNSPYKLIAADVNGDGKVTALDIVYMKRLILGIDTTFTNTTTKENRLWAFVDSSYKFADSTNPFPFKDSISYTNLNANQINQTFIGIKLGDVNWDWNPAMARSLPALPKRVLIQNTREGIIQRSN